MDCRLDWFFMDSLSVGLSPIAWSGIFVSCSPCLFNLSFSLPWAAPVLKIKF